MNNQMDRSLTIPADGGPVTGCARAKLPENERLILCPSLFMLQEGGTGKGRPISALFFGMQMWYDAS